MIEIFDRFNRNVQKLNEQELRHARFSGRFASLMEGLTDDKFWKDLGFFGNADIRRMKDVEYVASIFSLTMKGITEGEDLDSDYAAYDEELPEAAVYLDRYQRVKQLMSNFVELVKTTRFGNRGDFYSLWSALLDKIGAPESIDFAATNTALTAFAVAVDEVPNGEPGHATPDAQRYSQAVRAGVTKQQNRQIRKELLLKQFV